MQERGIEEIIQMRVKNWNLEVRWRFWMKLIRRVGEVNVVLISLAIW